jgi:hypothetical protein
MAILIIPVNGEEVFLGLKRGKLARVDLGHKLQNRLGGII